MGCARWNPDDWDHYASTHTKGKDRATVFSARGLRPDLDPRNIKLRESVDSDANPRSTPVIVALDVTGSMGTIPHQLVQGNLGTLMDELLARQPVSDPHLMFMGVGDVACTPRDRAPLQVTQFEADLRIADQLREIYLEGGGGGNRCESYHLPWYFAAMKTSIDSMAKRQKKGYLFTIGDEAPPAELTRDQVEHVFGEPVERDLSASEVLTLAQRNYHVFHIVIEESGHFRTYGDEVMAQWNALLGQRVIRLSDHTRLAEVIVSTIQATEGADRDGVSRSWSGDTSLVVARALAGLPGPVGDAGGLVRL